MNHSYPVLTWLRTKPLVLGVSFLLVAWLCFWIGFRLQPSIQHRNNTRIEQTSWVWVDAVTRSGSGVFEGDLLLPATNSLWIENSAGAHIILRLNDQIVYDGTTSQSITVLDSVTSPTHFMFTYVVDGSFPARGVIGLTQEVIPGIRMLIPAWRYGESNPLLDVVRALFVILLIAAVICLVLSVRLNRQHWVLIILVFTVALVVRLIVLNDKFNFDPTIWTMENVWDNYIRMGREWLGGIIRVGGNEFQQGTFIYLGMLQFLIGPSLEPLYILHTVVAAFVPVILMAVGWVLFNQNRSVGIFAGVMAALYPPLIHYQLTLQDTSPLMVIVSLTLLGLAVYHQHGSVAALVLTGAIIGLGTVFRSTILFLMLALIGVVCLRQMKFSSRIVQLGLAATAMLLCILPVTIANLTAGVPTLTANLFDYQMFRSNNLNSVGLNTFNTQSEQLAELRGDTWSDALTREITRNPGRLIELTARRIGLFWDPVEHGDSGMIDYRSTGLAISPLLNALTLGGIINQWTLMLLAIVGVGTGLLDRSKRPMTLILVFAFGAYMASLALFYVIGRVRIPLSPILLVLAAAAIVNVAGSRRHIRSVIVLVLSVILGLVMVWVVSAFPRPNFIAQPQPDVINTSAQFDDSLRLIGYAHYDTNYQANGYLTFEMIWQSLRSMDTDYVVSVRFVNMTTNRVDAVQNFTLGSLSVPMATARTWSANSTFYERYVLRLPEVAANYELYVGVYDPVNERLLPVSDTNRPVQNDHVRLTAVAVAPKLTNDLPDSSLAVWGDSLRLVVATCETDAAGQSTVRLSWQVDQRPPDAMTLFMHALMDGNLIEQNDQHTGEFAALDGLPIGSTFDTVWEINGVVDSVRLGLYDWAVNRWEVTQHTLPNADNTVAIGCSSFQPFPNS